MPGQGKLWLWGSLLDVVLLLLAIAGACGLRLGWPPPEENVWGLSAVIPVAMVSLPSIYYGFGLYLRRPLRLVLRSAVFAQGVLFLVTLAGAFWFRGFSSPRSVLVIAFALHFLAVIGWRWGLEKTTHSRPQRVIVVATRDDAISVVEKLLQEPAGWYEIIGVIEPDQLFVEGAQALGQSDLIVVGPSVVGPVRHLLLEAAARVGAKVFVVPELSDILIVGSTVGKIGDVPVFEIRPLSLNSRQLVAKRVLDLVLAVPLLVVVFPIMAVVAAAIKLTSPGPVLYRQKRVGFGGKEFVLYKFRTMVVDAEKNTGPVLATANDPRITPIGDFLRATRLDELPQLFNVIRGDMSLVGPRPERPYFVEQFCREQPEYALRHLIPPGVTGLAQVMGRYCTSVQDKLRYDLYYIRHYSIWLDLKILLLTLQAVISRESAIGVNGMESPEKLRAKELVLERFTQM